MRTSAALPGAREDSAARTSVAAPARQVPAMVRWLTLLSVLVLFAVSGGLLWDLGINYEGLSGGAASKIHPSTYLIILLFALAAASSGDVIGYCLSAAARRPASAFLIATTMVFFLQVVLRHAPGMAGIIDTFIPAALIVLLTSRYSERDLRPIETIIHAIMTINALMALFEFATGHLIFPYRFDGAVFETDLRSTALQGHPLANAMITATYALAVLSGGGTLSGGARGAIVLLQCLALVAFGGRSAMVITVVLGGAALLLQAHRNLSRGHIPLLACAGAALLLTLVPLAIGGLAAQGFFDALAARFVDDGGSANARIKMFEMFSQLPFRSILFGPNPDLVDSIRRVNGLEWGIENPILRTIFYHGLAITVLQTVAVVAFISEIVRGSRKGLFFPVLAFVILLNTAETIGVKTILLTKFAIMIICFYRRPPLTVRAAADPAHRAGYRRGGD
ncbi:VpsF family polysaccharide biosynthesis protein [Aurantimonas sp. VKM B-3413]|uniref:VpsF family polysaccharide biosynthesis protein n=1 Tax=Aurantimonas sp. VKM B-3413 TaxID=2779401 RepID=UPI001E2F3895|nr:VpsF family polysaccharide biosynthesis protein [Aurantimonas sp. VKM B-3413]MCB8840776.1 VpsF family polysaccharide biosynthesis protein [Aurantimonas sp. VKM B-3413]